MMKKAMGGFTLAEVLTTLMVIGVVAAMTIPTLMNSTNEQQNKVAFKKAMSILGQGVQLMTAQEKECTVGNSHQLASCMSNVIAGSLYKSGTSSTDPAEADSTNGNVIVTADGMAYAFYYSGDNANYDRTLSDICGESFSNIDSSDTAAKYNGSNAKCLVVVDVNGIGKGSKYLPSATNATAAAGATFASEQAAMILTGGGVRPTFSNAASNKESLARGWKWMYSTVPYTATTDQ